MSTKIGSAWEGVTENGKSYISIKLSEEITSGLLKPVFNEETSLILWFNDPSDNDKAPQYSLNLSKYVPKEKVE